MNWKQLTTAAIEETEALLAALPPGLKEKARALPVLYERYPDDELVESGIAPDTMGLFEGPSLMEGADTVEGLPPQVTLFLMNILDEAEDDPDRYRQEVRTTLLHELGHYLGLEEGDLIARDLE